ncbi:hypothetical protein [Pseudobacteroides cellulosolvens]|nr:hypothetical protein [Pseudobacteroides cellulosolvens]
MVDASFKVQSQTSGYSVSPKATSTHRYTDRLYSNEYLVKNDYLVS